MSPRTAYFIPSIVLAALAPALATAPARAQPVPDEEAAPPPPTPRPEARAGDILVPPAPALTPGARVTEPATGEEASVTDDGFDTPVKQRTMHGFRLGYMYVSNFDKLTDPEDPESSLMARADMKSPHLFLIGYEVTRRLIGHSWLNLILVGNVTVGGLEQSKFYPSANALIGFEFEESFQVGVGPNLAPDPDKVAHIMFAGGWTPSVGSFRVPVHAFYIPDVDGVWRSGVTVGVNW